MFDLRIRMMTAEIERDLRARGLPRMEKIGATFPRPRSSSGNVPAAAAPTPRPVDRGIAEPS